MGFLKHLILKVQSMKVLWILTGNIGHDRNKDNGIR